MLARLKEFAVGLDGRVASTFLRWGLRGDQSDDRHVVLLAAPGAGNIGDQAMLESAVAASSGPMTVLLAAPAAGLVPEGVRSLVVPHLVGGRGPRRWLDALTAGRAIAAGSALWVIGADTMDGGYSDRVAAAKWDLVIRTARSGRESRVLGFSWNERPGRRALRGATKASQAGAALFVRDPESARRLRDSGSDVRDAADIVFTLPPLTDPGPQAPRDAPVLVNVSGLICRDPAMVDQYARAVDDLTRMSLVEIVPHVDRGSSGDPAATRLVLERAGLDGDKRPVVHDLMSPADVRELASRSRFVVTGRMHLAVLALSRGIPAIVISTQGKVQGLMNLMGTPWACVEVGPDLARDVAAAVEHLVTNEEAVRASVARSLLHVRELAELNFS